VKLLVKGYAIPLVLMMGLVGCASKDEEVLVLPEIDNKVVVDKVWNQSVGDGVEHYDSQLKPIVVGEKLYAKRQCLSLLRWCILLRNELHAAKLHEAISSFCTTFAGEQC
jgi:hypothetical protein